MLEELASHCETAGALGAADKQILLYLTALNKVFERGILSSSRVSTMEAKELENMTNGFKYSEDWCMDLRAARVDPDDTTQTSFLAWQVNQGCN